MSERGKKSRADGRAKASRLAAKGDPKQKVDASSWTPGDSMNTTAKTGLRPIRPRTYKAGGRIQGDRAAPQRADKTPRKQPKEVVGEINRDVKAANAKLGKPHVGGMKTGGRAKRFMGGPMANTQVSPNRMEFEPVTKPGGLLRKKGGATPAGDGPGMKAGDRVPRADGGRTKAKGKTNINIVIGTPASAQNTPPGPIKPPPAPPPMPMGGPPPGMPPGPPPAMPMGGNPGASIPGMPPPPQMRKAGGRTIHPTAGAGSGLGRLQKARFEARGG